MSRKNRKIGPNKGDYRVVKPKKVTEPVTAGALTDAEKIKIAEPIKKDILDLMDTAAEIGEQIGAVQGRMEGYRVGVKAPRSYGEVVVERKMDAIDAALAEVKRELIRAYTKFPADQSSPHESYAVLLEETDELWDEIKADRGRLSTARKEGVQAAAMAVRYLVDIDP